MKFSIRQLLFQVDMNRTGVLFYYGKLQQIHQQTNVLFVKYTF